MEWKEKGVRVILGQSLGTNVVKMRKGFVVVVSRTRSVSSALLQLSGRIGDLQDLWEQGEARVHLVLHR